MGSRMLCVAVLLTALGSWAHGADPCGSVASLPLPDVRITSARAVSAPASHCKVTGVIGRNVGFSIWLPENWNGRFVMGGAGGFVAEEDNQALRLIGDRVLRDGYATASTDTGHKGGGGSGAWALNDLEAIVNYGHLAMHRAVVTAKAVVAGHYRREADKSFFVGCSNGGRQALHEAQKYPDDFDAIIAGAPALNFTGVAAGFLNIVQHMFPDPARLNAALVTPADRSLLRTAIEARCDALDDVRDGVLQDPLSCDFDPAQLACAAGGGDNCLPAAKIRAIQAVYGGPRSSTGPIFFGFPFGAEATDANGWGSWLTGGSNQGPPNAAYAFGVGILRYMVHHDPEWDYTTTDWERFESDIEPLAHLLDAKDPDLAAFRARGGKLLMYHGWADVALTGHMSTDYIERVYAADPTARTDARLFMMPGMLHCYGGAGPSVVDWLAVLEEWHDSGTAPDDVAAGYPDKTGARKLCAWPGKAVIAGPNSEDPASYTCQ